MSRGGEPHLSGCPGAAVWARGITPLLPLCPEPRQCPRGVSVVVCGGGPRRGQGLCFSQVLLLTRSVQKPLWSRAWALGPHSHFWRKHGSFGKRTKVEGRGTQRGVAGSRHVQWLPEAGRPGSCPVRAHKDTQSGCGQELPISSPPTPATPTPTIPPPCRVGRT